MDSSSEGSEASFELDPSLDNLSPRTPGEPVDLVEQICRYLNKRQTNTKKFLLSYLKSTNNYIVTRRKQWGSVKKGWKTTEEVLDAIADLVNAKPKCRKKWNDWILKKAKVIVAAQSPPTGSLYININKLDQSFFDHEKDVEREASIVESMDFIHELISFKLGVDKMAAGETTSESSGSDTSSDLEPDSDLPPHMESQLTIKSADAYVYHKSKDKAENTNTRMKAENARKMKSKIKAAGRFGFLICIDNLDMMERVHSRRLEATSKTYHGTWGYIHYLNPDILTDLNSEECTVPAFQGFLKADCEKPVNSGDLISSKDENKRWNLTLKNQIARVLLRYMKNPKKYKELLVLNLVAIDQIQPERPNINMLKLMDSSDNGSDGISSLYDELTKQTGLSPEDFSSRPQILEGDLGTYTIHNHLDMSVELFEKAIEKVFVTYLSGRAIRLARCKGDSKRLQLLLRLRDFATIGPGTDIQRLKETFSLTVGLLSQLVNTMKGRAGQNDVRQSRKNKSTPASMM
ncbi:hypothetical protein DFH28DRAFT_1171531, partial [Melampsora americana]